MNIERGLLTVDYDGELVNRIRDGDLLVRADPERADELLTAKGTRQAEMGDGRVMNKGWIAVGEEAIASDENFDFWIGVALEYNDKETGALSRGRKQKGAR